MTDRDLPLCVDLDGTLLRSDLLVESALGLIKRNPLFLLVFPGWLLRGKAVLKREIAARSPIDFATLPWDSRVVEHLRNEQGRRQLVLCTASDQCLADGVAAELGLFDTVVGSDGARNLAGRNKAEWLVAKYGERGFDYMGNSGSDIAVWARSRRAHVVNGGPALASAAGRVTELAGTIPPESGGLGRWLRALRLHQWLKNLLVILPLLTAHRLFEPVAVTQAVLAFLAFGLCASGVYVLNDLLDLAADRRHPRKRKRPFAAGDLPVLHGMLVVPLLTIAAFAIALAWLPTGFTLTLLVYAITTLVYSFGLKRVVMLDTVVLATLYTLRIIAGTLAIGSAISFWLLSFSMFVFLSLAMLKRHTELKMVADSGGGGAGGRGYRVDDLPIVQSLGTASGYISVLVLALYINSKASEELYRHADWLWLLCPPFLYWISRIWLIAHRGQMHDDPVVFAVRDKVSLGVLVLMAVIAVMAI